MTQLSDKISVLRIPARRLENKIELTKFVVDILCYINSVKLSHNETLILCHFIIDGYNEVSKEKAIGLKIVKDKKAMANVLTSLRKNKILYRENKFPFTEKLAPAFRSILPDKLKIEIPLEVV